MGEKKEFGSLKEIAAFDFTEQALDKYNLRAVMETSKDDEIVQKILKGAAADDKALAVRTYILTKKGAEEFRVALGSLSSKVREVMSHRETLFLKAKIEDGSYDELVKMGVDGALCAFLMILHPAIGKQSYAEQGLKLFDEALEEMKKLIGKDPIIGAYEIMCEQPDWLYRVVEKLEAADAFFARLAPEGKFPPPDQVEAAMPIINGPDWNSKASAFYFLQSNLKSFEAKTT